MSKTYNFNEMINDYLNTLLINNYSQKTYINRKSILTNFFKDTNINDKESFNKHFKEYAINNNSKGYSKYTNYALVSALKSFTKYYKLDWCDDLKNPKLPKTLPKHLTKEEINQMTKKLMINPYDSETKQYKQHITKCLFYLLYSSGLRVSEVSKLQINDIDLTNKLIKVRGKGSKDRVVIFNDTCKESLINYLEFRKKYLKNKNKKGYFLFPSFRGVGHITTHFIENTIKQLGEESKINKKVTPHILRHSFATHLLSDGMNLKGIQQLLGHTSLATTQIYTNLNLEEIQEMYKL